MGSEAGDRLLTAIEVAGLLRIHLVTVYAWCAEGRLPSIKLGRKRLFDRRELERWIANQTTPEREAGAHLAGGRRRRGAAAGPR